MAVCNGICLAPIKKLRKSSIEQLKSRFCGEHKSRISLPLDSLISTFAPLTSQYCAVVFKSNIFAAVVVTFVRLIHAVAAIFDDDAAVLVIIVSNIFERENKSKKLPKETNRKKIQTDFFLLLVTPQVHFILFIFYHSDSLLYLMLTLKKLFLFYSLIFFS